MFIALDKSNLRQIICDLPNQYLSALDFSKNIRVRKRFNNVIVSGMGGSALPADIVKVYLESVHEKIPIYVNRDYTLPFITNKKSLILISSYSGNTEESLCVFQEALKKKLKIVGFTSGGKLERLCKQNGLPLVKYPKKGPNFQPRMAYGYAFTSMISVLANSGLIADRSKDIIDLAKFLKKLDLEKKGKAIGKSLAGYIPVFYSSEKYLMAVSRINKIKINENSKTPSFFNAFPELNHNEMVGFTNFSDKFHIIIFQDPQDHVRIQKRMKITAELLKKKGCRVTLIKMQGKSILEKIFSSLLLGDWISYYLALELGQDPTPVKMVENFKEKMRGKS